MILYLLRHGIAADNSDDGTDQARELTDEGREKLSALLHRASRSGVAPNVILTSPYKRAQQTARLASKILGGGEPIINKALAPDGNPRELWNSLREYCQASELLLASHEPLLSSTVAYLLDSPAMRVDVKKGALIAIDFTAFRGEPRGTLRWMLIPRLCG